MNVKPHTIHFIELHKFKPMYNIVITVTSLVRTESLMKHIESKPTLVYDTLNAPEKVVGYKFRKYKDKIHLTITVADLSCYYLEFVNRYLEYLNNIKISEIVETEFGGD